MLVADIFKSILVGVCLAAPIGPVVVTVSQKSLTYGRKVGFKSGLGCATMDTVYAAISFVALSLISGFLQEHKPFFAVLGGVVVIFFGVMMLLSDPVGEMKKERLSEKKAYWQTFLMVLTNPGSMLYDFFVCSLFGLVARDWKVAVLSAGVFLGEVLFWYVITSVCGHFQRSFNERTIRLITRLGAAALFVCGIVVMIKGFI